MQVRSESVSTPPQFSTKDTIPDGFVSSVALILLVMAVTLFLVLKPAKEYIYKFLGSKRMDKPGSSTVDQIRLSPRTTLYKVIAGKKTIFVVESSLNTSIAITKNGVDVEEMARSEDGVMK